MLPSLPSTFLRALPQLRARAFPPSTVRALATATDAPVSGDRQREVFDAVERIEEEAKELVLKEMLAAGMTLEQSAPAPLQPPQVHLRLRHLFRPSPVPPPVVLPLPSSVFTTPLRRDILHACVLSELSSQRSSTNAHTKRRGEVRGSKRKIRPQKGSGKARLGARQSPMLRGGGVSHGPRNTRVWLRKVNNKVWALGMRVALAEKFRAGLLHAVPTPNLPRLHTRTLAQQLSNLGWHTDTLFITPDEQFHVAAGNIDGIDVLAPEDVGVYDLVRWPRVVADVAGLEGLLEVLGEDAGEWAEEAFEMEEFEMDEENVREAEEVLRQHEAEQQAEGKGQEVRA